MSTLFVHVGHNKTGSSFIQSSLALSLDRLENCGITYPEYSTLKTAAKGGISSGNGAILLKQNQDFTRFAGQSILLSNEKLFIALLKRRHAERLHRVAEQIGTDRIKILLMTRNPIDHASSVYQQNVKRGGYTESIDSLYEEYSYPELVSEFMSHPQLGAHPNVEVTLRNYSSISTDLNGAVAEWLEVPSESIIEPPFAVVNRSLTVAELEFQRIVNQSLGASGNLLSDKLCNVLPDIRSDKVIPSRNKQKELLDRLDAAMNFVDAHLPEGEKYERELVGSPEAQTRELRLSVEQVNVIGTSMAKEIKDLRRQIQVQPAQVSGSYAKPMRKTKGNQVVAEFGGRLKPKPGQQPADILREVALGFESIGDIGTAYAVMNKALCLRPKGKLILRKCAEYKALLMEGQ